MSFYDDIAYQSADVIAFMRSLQIDPNGNIVRNLLDENDNLTYVSKFYTPHLETSALSTTILNKLHNTPMPYNNEGAPTDSIPYQVSITSLQRDNPMVYMLVQSTALELFSVFYAFDYDQTLLNQLDANSLFKARQNVMYCEDYMFDDAQYDDLLRSLRAVDTSLGSIANQIPAIKQLYADNGYVPVVEPSDATYASSSMGDSNYTLDLDEDATTS